MNWNEYLDKVFKNLFKCKDDFNDFKSLNSNRKRIDYLISKKTYLNQIDLYLSDTLSNKKDDDYENEKKSEAKSLEYRLKGNEFYVKKQPKQAFKNYTLSLMYAPVFKNFCEDKNKSIILAYSNRSAVLFNEKLYEMCLNDLYSCQDIFYSYFYINNIFTSSDDDKNLKNLNDLFNLIFKLIKIEINC